MISFFIANQKSVIALGIIRRVMLIMRQQPAIAWPKNLRNYEIQFTRVFRAKSLIC